jgi:lipoprotein Spr
LIKEKVLRNVLSLPLLILFLTTFSASAQIITSKQEAQKKLVYTSIDKQASVKGQAVTQLYGANTNTPKNLTKAKEVLFLDNDVVLVYDDQPIVKEKAKGGPRKVEAPKNSSKNKTVIVDEPDTDFVPVAEENYFAQQIVNNAMQFEGVRYRGGGTTPAGMDCSGMVYATFQIFDVTLPRSSASMAATAGEDVKLDEVKKGDLLFFSNNRRRGGINHVGLVTEITPEGVVKFIHASTSQGVMVSSMNENYHSRTFVKAKRVIEQ